MFGSLGLLTTGGVKMTIFFSITLLISSLILIISVVSRESTESLGALSGDTEQSLFGKNRSSGKEAVLNRMIIVSAVVFFISAIVLAA